MFDDLVRWATTHPLGITVTGTVIAAAVIAVVARVSRGFRSALRRIWSTLTSVRLTTAPTPRLPLAPARWALRPTGDKEIWALINHGAGDAQSVQLDPVDGASMVIGTGFWKSVPGKHLVGVRLALGSDHGWRDESTFEVRWFDARRSRWSVHLEVFPRDRYKGVESLPKLKADELSRLAE